MVAEVLKLKCESMPYRSYFERNTCYFAIHGEVKHGDVNCSNILVGAKMRVDRERERVLGVLHLDASKYHSATIAGQAKHLLCSLDTQFTCEHGALSLPGRCVIRSEKSITWTEASNFCRSKGADSIAIHNAYEDKIIAGVLGKNETGWLLPSRGDVWSAENQTIDYWKWFFENAKTDCAIYGPWLVDTSTNKNIALCIRHAECPLCPPPRNVPPPETTTTSTSTTTVATTTTTPKKAICSPRNDPPRQNDLWDLKFYYNWGRKLHAFAATAEGLKLLQDNGIRYCPKAGFGSLGGTISDEGFKRLHEHIFEASTAPKEIYVGYVSIKEGACGSKWPVKKWSAIVSADMMYAGDLSGSQVEKAEWYRGREQDSGRIHFWLWEMNEKARDAQRKGDCTTPSDTAKNAPNVTNVGQHKRKGNCSHKNRRMKTWNRSSEKH